MTDRVPSQVANNQIKQWLRGMVADVLDSIELGVSTKIIFVLQRISNDRTVLLAKVTVKSKEVALRIRK
jgi:hypothetical protein